MLGENFDPEDIFMAFSLAFVIIKSFDANLQCGTGLTCTDIVSQFDVSEIMDVFGCTFRLDSNVLGHAFRKYQKTLNSDKMNLNWLVENTKTRTTTGDCYKAFGKIPVYPNNYIQKVSFLNRKTKQYNDRHSWIQRYRLSEVISDRELLSLISCELLDLEPSRSHCITQLCGPVVLLDQLLSAGDALEALAKFKSTDSATIRNQEFMDKLDERITREISAVKSAVHEHYPTLKHLTQDIDFHKHLEQNLWTSCTSDVKLAPTLFHIFFLCSTSSTEDRILHVLGNPDIISELVKGRIVQASDFVNKIRDDPGNVRFAASMRQRELFCDFLLHLVINAGSKGQTALCWIEIITSLLKDGQLIGTHLNLVNKLHLSFANTTSLDSKHESLRSFHIESMKMLAEKASDPSFGFVGLIDNYAKQEYAAESTLVATKDFEGTKRTEDTKKFASTTDSLAGLVHPFRWRQDVRTDPERPSATVDLVSNNWVGGVVDAIKSPDGILDLKGTMNEPSGEPIRAKYFPHLSDFTPLASLKAKSSHHISIAQVLLVVMFFFLNALTKEIFLPGDPEFVLEAIVFSIVLPRMMRNMIFTIPPFHMQKHAMESLESQFVFMLLIKISFANAIGFKPSVFEGLQERIFKALAKFTLPPEAKITNAANIYQDMLSELSSGDGVESRAFIDEIMGSFDEIVNEDNEDNEDLSNMNDDEITEMLTSELINASGESMSELDRRISKYNSVDNLVPLNLAKLIYHRNLEMVFNWKEGIEKKKKKEDRVVDKRPEWMEHLSITLNDIRDSWLTNHQRLKYNDELLYAVVMHSCPTLDKENIWEANSITLLIQDLLKNQLSLCVEPFNLLNGEGYIQPLYENLPKLMKLFSVGKKSKIVKSAIFLLAEVLTSTLHYDNDFMKYILISYFLRFTLYVH